MRLPRRVESWLSATRARRYLAALLAAAAGAAVVVVVSTADGYSVNSVTLGTGDVWVASSGPGQLALLDGSSAAVAVKLAVAPAGSDLLAVQGTGAGYAVNRTVGSIVRVDAARWTTSDAIALIKDSTAGLSAVATADALYAIDDTRGLVQEADPVTLQARGGPRSLSAQPAPGSPVVDDKGVMWLLDSRSGDLIRVARNVDRTAPAIGTSEAARLVLAGGSPVIVDPAVGSVIPIDPESGQPAGQDACIDTNRLDTTVRVGGGTSSAAIYAVSGADGVLRITDVSTGRCDLVVPGIAPPGSDLGMPIEVGRHVFIPDFTAGDVVVVDLDSFSTAPTEQIVSPGTNFDLLARDGFVFYNQSWTEKAGIVRVDGTVRTIAKYDVADPGKGVHEPEPNQDPTLVAAAVESAASSMQSAAAAEPGSVPTDLAVSTPETPRPPTPHELGTGGSGVGSGGAGGGGGGVGVAGGRGATAGSAISTVTTMDTVSGTLSSGTVSSGTVSSSTVSSSTVSSSTVSSSTPVTVPTHVDSASELEVTIPSSGLVDQPIAMSVRATAGSTVTGATWTFDDGTATGVAVTHPWSTPGSHWVKVEATRASGATQDAGGPFPITITKPADTTPPEWGTFPGDITASAVDASGAFVTYEMPTASDSESTPTVNCVPGSGQQFALGSSEVTCSATDSAGNSIYRTLRITVVDDQPPVFVNMPDDQFFTIPADASSISWDYTDPTAVDNVDPNPTVSCPHPGTYGLGLTRVDCEAKDFSVNRTLDGFKVTVVRYTGCPELDAQMASVLSQIESLHAELLSAAPGEKAAIAAQIAELTAQEDQIRAKQNEWGCP